MSCTKLQLPPEPVTRGLSPPDPRSLCPLSSTEFVEPPPNKIPGYATAGTHALLPDRYKMNMRNIFKDHWPWQEKRIDAEPLRRMCKCLPSADI